MNNKEIRSIDNLEATSDDSMTVEGYALKYNTWSEDLGFYETIDKDALKDTDLSDVRCYFNHDSSKVLGRTVSGTLELELDDVGLRFSCNLPNTTHGRDVYESVKRGDISQCSFAFNVDDEGSEFSKRSDGIYERVIRKIKSLWEISIVSMPAYQDTNVSVAERSIEKIEESIQEELRMKQEAEQKELELMKLQLELLRLKK